MKHSNVLPQVEATLTLPAIPLLQEAHFELAYKKSFLGTLRFIRSMGANSDTAEEVAQAAWARGWQCRRQLLKPELVVAWINAIARNLYLAMIALERRFADLEEIPAPCTLLRNMEAGSLMKGCTGLESRMLTMYYVEGYTAREIASKENLCATTVRVRLMRIRRNLRERLSLNLTSQITAQPA